MRRSTILAMAFGLLIAPGRGLAQTPDDVPTALTGALTTRASRTPQVEPGPSFADDVALGINLVGDALAAPLHWTGRQWLTLPAAAALLVAISPIDDDVDRFAASHQRAGADGYFDAIEPFGEEYSFLVAGGVYLGGWLADRPALRRTAVEAAASSVVAAGVVTPALKLAFGRARPRERLGAYEFNPFSGDYSFPSGHTTQAFAVASAIAAESDALVVDLVAYGLAASVGAARIYHDAHFLTDVLAGAAIGTTVGRWMADRGRQRRGGATLAIGPAARGLVVTVRLPGP